MKQMVESVMSILWIIAILMGSVYVVAAPAVCLICSILSGRFM